MRFAVNAHPPLARAPCKKVNALGFLCWPKVCSASAGDGRRKARQFFDDPSRASQFGLAAVSEMTDFDAHHFAVEIVRREIQSCEDIDQLRALTLQVVDLMEAQRQWFLQTIADGWLSQSPPQASIWPPDERAA